jgi:hypothetical protein
MMIIVFIFFVFSYFHTIFSFEEKQFQYCYAANDNQGSIYGYDLVRINHLLEAFYLAKNNRDIPELEDNFKRINRYYLGLKIDFNLYETEDKDKEYIKQLIERLLHFNIRSSQDLQYLFDMELAYVFTAKKDIAAKIHQEKLVHLLLISYFGSKFFFDINIEDEENYREKEVVLEEFSDKLYKEIQEVLLLKNHFLYRKYENTFLSKIKKNKLFSNVLLVYDDCIERIARNTDIIDSFDFCFNAWKKELFQTEKFPLFESFGLWLLDREKVKINFFQAINQDFFLILFTIMQLEKSIVSLHETYYSDVSEEELEIIGCVANAARFFLKKIENVFDIENEKEVINIPLLAISEQRAKKIIRILKNIIE